MISAVGHEPDVTISDFVADLRAATPSNAAELAVPDQQALYQQLDSIMSAMETSLKRQLKAARQHLNALSCSPALKSPYEYIHNRRKNLQLVSGKLISAESNKLSRIRQRFVACISKLDAMSPLKVLSRGYAMTQDENKALIRSISQVSFGQTLFVTFNDGTLQSTVTQIKENRNESKQ